VIDVAYGEKHRAQSPLIGLYAEKRAFVDILRVACLIVDEISLFPEERVGIIACVASPVREFQARDQAWIKLVYDSAQRTIEVRPWIVLRRRKLTGIKRLI
jgi:hypothetical protein